MTKTPSHASRTTVQQATLELLRGLGMTTVFGNPGSTELPFLDSWPKDFRYILALQEASAVAMADGHARATGRAAFCNLHSAVGVGHAAGNIFTAFRNQAPLVISAGQQVRSLLPLNPFLGATEAANFPKPYVKWSCEPARAEDVPAALAHAYYVAMQKPYGPTFVSIPIDDWSAETDPIVPRTISGDAAPDPEAMAALAHAIGNAERPVFVIGPEVDIERAGDAAIALVERVRAPVWASPFSHHVSFPEEHPSSPGSCRRRRRPFRPHSPPTISSWFLAPRFSPFMSEASAPCSGAGSLSTRSRPMWMRRLRPRSEP